MTSYLQWTWPPSEWGTALHTLRWCPAASEPLKEQPATSSSVSKGHGSNLGRAETQVGQAYDGGQGEGDGKPDQATRDEAPHSLQRLGCHWALPVGLVTEHGANVADKCWQCQRWGRRSWRMWDRGLPCCPCPHQESASMRWSHSLHTWHITVLILLSLSCIYLLSVYWFVLWRSQ